MSVCSAVRVWAALAQRRAGDASSCRQASATAVPTSTVVPLVEQRHRCAASTPLPVNARRGHAGDVVGAGRAAIRRRRQVRRARRRRRSGVDRSRARPADATLVLPAMSVWRRRQGVGALAQRRAGDAVQLPAASATAVPSTAVASASNSVTVAPASAPLPRDSSAWSSLVMLSVFVPVGPS